MKLFFSNGMWKCGNPTPDKTIKIFFSNGMWKCGNPTPHKIIKIIFSNDMWKYGNPTPDKIIKTCCKKSDFLNGRTTKAFTPRLKDFLGIFFVVFPLVVGGFTPPPS